MVTSRAARTRRCARCGETLPLNARYFGRDATRPGGFQYACKVCLNARQREYHYERNRAAGERTVRDLERADWRWDADALTDAAITSIRRIEAELGIAPAVMP